MNLNLKTPVMVAVLILLASGCTRMAVIDRSLITESNSKDIRSTGSPTFVSQKIRTRLAFDKLEARVGVVFDNSGAIRGLGIRTTSGNAEYDALLVEYVASWSFHAGRCPDKPCHIEIPIRFNFRD